MQVHTRFPYLSWKVLTIGVFLLLSAWIQMQSVALADNTISGTVSLPNSELAPAGGLEVRICLHDEGNWNDYYCEYFTIAEDDNSTTFSVILPSDPVAGWIMYYQCNTCDNYVQSGYYSTTGTVNPRDASLLAPGLDHTNLIFPLLEANTVSGKVTLPSGDVAPAGGLEVRLGASTDDWYQLDHESVVIPEGASSGDFTINVPISFAGGLTIYYDCPRYCEVWVDNRYVEGGYYNSNGTVFSFEDATRLSSGQNHLGIDITILEGDIISGELSLPGDDAAPPGGLDIIIRVEPSSAAYWAQSQWVSIAESTSSASYSVLVPKDSTTSMRVNYEYYECGGCEYIDTGYYASGGTTYDSESATLLPGGSDHSNIDMTMLLGRTISGTIFRPSGASTTEAIDIYVNANSNNGPNYWYASTYITIPVGETSTTYNLTVTPDSGAQWQLGYDCYDCNQVIEWGYYATDAPDTTTWDQSQASLLDGGVDHTNKNLTLITGNTISGAVYRPSGASTAEAIDVYMNAHNINGNGWGYDHVTIPAGNLSTTYDLTVPPEVGAQWNVNYDCDEGNRPAGCSGYVDRGYYASSEPGTTTWDSNLASLLVGGTNHTGTNLTLLTGKTISGTVSRPAGAPTGEVIDIEVGTDNLNNSIRSDWTYERITIPAGSGSSTYILTVPDDSSAQWYVRFSCDQWATPAGCSDYLNDGFFASGETGTTTWDSNKASLLAGGEDYPETNLTLLTGDTISGTISRPSGVSTTEQISVSINIQNLNGSGWVYKQVTIPAGNNSTTYKATMLPDSRARWQVIYNCDQWSTPIGCSEYLRTGYYANGEPSTTTWDLNRASLLAGGTDYPNTNLTLLAGSMISGTVSLPGSDVAPAEGMYIGIRAENQDGLILFGEGVNINGAATSVDYSLNVPTDSNYQWHVSYDCLSNCDDYLNVGYYDSGTSGTTTWDVGQASLLIGGTDHTGKNLTLLTGNTISGTVSLPDSDVASSNAYIAIYAKDKNTGVSYTYDFVSITSGTFSIDYSLTVPPSNSIVISYDCNSGCEVYGRVGYFASDAPDTTTWDQSQATLLAGDSSQTGKNLTLLTGNIISGTVFFPGSDVAGVTGMYANINANDLSGGLDPIETSVKFEAATSSATYSLVVPPGLSSQLQISYECTYSCYDYVENGFYASGVTNTTTWDPGQASLLESGINKPGINMTLIPFMDTDTDGIFNDLDNCPSTGNPFQEDYDDDGLGDVCDDDADGDGALNDTENDFGTNWLDETEYPQAYDDVPPGNLYYEEVLRLDAAGIVTSCDGADNFCPDQVIQRDTVAIWLTKAFEGEGYAPAPATGTVFADVDITAFGADYIEDLSLHGGTEGCDAATPLPNYCPQQGLTKDQAAKMLLKTKYGARYNPSPSGLVFDDVTTETFAAGFIEALKTVEVATEGCADNPALYCPSATLTRGGFAKMLANTFGLMP